MIGLGPAGTIANVFSVGNLRRGLRGNGTARDLLSRSGVGAACVQRCSPALQDVVLLRREIHPHRLGSTLRRGAAMVQAH